jgi:TctA family transporter
MVTDDRATPHAWLDAGAIRAASDIVLGCILLAAAAAAILGAGDAFIGGWNRLGPGFFPSAVGGLLVVTGLTLLVRGAALGTPPAARWGLTSLAIAVSVYAAGYLAVWVWGPALLNLALLFGPPEYVTLMLLILAVAIALARLSRVRAVGMVLLGLLLAIVGTDVSTGEPRFTMGVQQLADGILYPVVLLGLIVVADGLLCLASPSLLLATYARRIVGWTGPRIPNLAAIAMRLTAVLAVAAAVYYAFELNRAIWDVGMLVAFGLFGLLCKTLGWNRPVLILGFAYGVLLEENIRRALVLSRGDPAIIVSRPISGTLLALAAFVLLLAGALSMSRMLRRHGTAHS